MPLASSNRSGLAFIQEVTFGVVPGAGTARSLRYTGESLNFDISKETSKEIRADRQNSGATSVDASGSGGINFEMQYREYDPFIAAAMMSDFAVYGTDGIGTAVTAAFAATTLTADVAPTGSSAYTTLARGQWFRLSAGANANHGKFFKVSNTVAPTSTVITVDASTPFTAGTGVAGVVVQTSRISNDVVQKSFSIERQALDVAQFMTYSGMNVSKMMWKFASGALSEGSFDFLGKGMTRTGATALPSAPAASQTFDIQNGVRGMGQLWEGGAPLAGTFIRSLDVSLDNNLRAQTALANFGAVGVGVGDVKVTGNFEAYFSDGNLFDKFLADQYTSVTVGTQDSAGNGYVVTLPRIQIMTGKVNAGSKNQDMMASFTYEGFADLANAAVANRKVIFVDRVGVAASV